ncbi:MAG: dihydropteroate synthase [Steroidobacteraceae bacterium]|nr:dihydropteroate synthase [Steroidobacteraceae bacterium]
MRLACGSRLLDLSVPVVMGIVNVTPDSFSDGGRFHAPDAALRHAEQLIAEGAAIVDIGGESTRPGAAEVSEAEEIDRVVPVIERLSGSDVVISVDTSKPGVMRAAVAAGAAFINDIRGLRTAEALAAACALPAAVSIMHMQGEPATMQRNPRYNDVVSEVRDFLSNRAQACLAAGTDCERIVIDPGFGFGKDLSHNLQLLRALPQFVALGFPVLVGLSRKSMLGQLTGRPVDQRLAGSVALATVAVLRGAHILRAHDVAATVDAIKVAAPLTD